MLLNTGRHCLGQRQRHVTACSTAKPRPRQPCLQSQAAKCLQQPETLRHNQLLALGMAGMVLLSAPGAALAEQKVGEFTASGIIFKDSVEAMAIEDPDVGGVTVYISDFQRSLKDKFANFFSEPSQASVTCAITGPIVIQDINRIKGREGNEVFSERRGLGLLQNKTLRVRRLYDEARKTLLYIAYSTRLTNDTGESPGRYRTSICALPISPDVANVPKTSTNESSGLFSGL